MDLSTTDILEAGLIELVSEAKMNSLSQCLENP